MDRLTILYNNLIGNSIFYVPEVFLNKLKPTIFEGVFPVEKCDSIGFYNEDRTTTSKIDNLTALKLGAKKVSLDENLMILFEAKKITEAEHFDNLLEKYHGTLVAYLQGAKWMHTNITNRVPNVIDTTVNHFKYQVEIFQTHYNDIIKNFGAHGIKPKEVKDDIAKILREKFSHPNFKIAVPDLHALATGDEQKSKKGKSNFNIEEIDNFLLSSVFKVKL